MNFKNKYNLLIIISIVSLFLLLLSFYFSGMTLIFFQIIIVVLIILLAFYMKKNSDDKSDKIVGLESKYLFLSEISKKIVNELDYALVITDTDFNIIEKTDSFNDIFNINENIDTTLNNFIINKIKNKDNFKKKIDLLKNGTTSENCSIELLLENNSIIKTFIFYINNSSALRNKEYVFLFKDHTEERKSSTNFEILINNIDEMVAIYNYELKIIKYNAAYRKFFLDFEEVEVYSKMNILESLDTSKKEFWNEIFTKGIEGEKLSKEVKYISKTEDKSIDLNIDTTSIFNSSGEITGFIISMKDISKIRNMEFDIANLRGELGKNIGAKEEFFDNLNSEIRTPLNNIINGIELMSVSISNGKESELVEIIKNSSENILTLLNDMSDYLKIESEHKKSKLEIFDIEKEISLVFQEFNINNEKEKINIKLNSINIVNREVYGDIFKFRKIISSILHNILKTSNSQEISITIEEYESCQNIVEYGISIENESSGAINEFENGKSFINSISILIAEKIIESMNGTVVFRGIKNNKGKYSFKVKFEKLIIETVKKSATIFAMLENKKVLIVEDNRMNQIVMEKLLKMVKINSDLAENGLIAFEKYKTGVYDLILMDIQMPIMNGYETSKNIRLYEQNTGKRIPIIALTAYAMQSDRDKCLEAGMDDYMSKPVIKNELFEMLEKYIV